MKFNFRRTDFGDDHERPVERLGEILPRLFERYGIHQEAVEVSPQRPQVEIELELVA